MSEKKIDVLTKKAQMKVNFSSYYKYEEKRKKKSF